MADPDNDKIKMYIHVPKGLWELVTKVAETIDAKPKWCMERLLARIEELCADGQAKQFGDGWGRAFNQLTADGVDLASSGPRVDISHLERARNKSGFAGVYANGKGYRAEARDPVTKLPRHIGTYQSAEAAALARYRYYEQHGMIYGAWGTAIERLREDPLFADMSEDELKTHAAQRLTRADLPQKEWWRLETNAVLRYQRVRTLPVEQLARTTPPIVEEDRAKLKAEKEAFFAKLKEAEARRLADKLEDEQLEQFEEGLLGNVPPDLSEVQDLGEAPPRASKGPKMVEEVIVCEESQATKVH
jgi:hypothetical protein